MKDQPEDWSDQCLDWSDQCLDWSDQCFCAAPDPMDARFRLMDLLSKMRVLDTFISATDRHPS